MTLEELKKIRTILSAATGLEDEDQEIIGAALKAIDALIKPRTTKPAAPVQELQRYSPNGEGGMEVDSLGAYVKHQDVSNPPEAPVQERELAGFAMKDGIPVSAVFSDGSHAVSVDGFTWTAQPPAAPVQKRPQNCGTGYCSCIECVMEPAPVQPVAWADAYAISNLPAVDEAIRALLDDKTADNATAVVQAILGAVPPKQPAPVQETCRECAGEGIQGEDGDGFVSGVTWRCDSCNGTGKSAPPAAPVQVDAWPCVIAEADFEQDTITLKMQCSDYKVGAGQHWLHTTKPAAQPAQPAVPDAIHHTDTSESLEYIHGRNDCRQAMLEMMK